MSAQSDGDRLEALHSALERIDAGAALEDVLSTLDDESVTAEIRSLVAMRATVEEEGFMSAPAAIPQVDAPPLHRVGRFDVERVIGTGASGTVYRAMQQSPRRAVALKVLDRTLARPDARRRFEHEAELLAALDHPGIARVIEAGVHADAATPPGGLPYLAMELVEDAASIIDYAAAHDLDGAARLQLLIEACDAVGHAHGRGIVHRDVKPANLLVDGAGRVKVIDLGIARLLDDRSGLASMHTATGSLVGTLRYMSPEQADGRTSVDARSDVYALGVVLYEVVCGRMPYDVDASSIAASAAIIRERPPLDPAALGRPLPAGLPAVMLTALAKDPEARYPDATSLALELRRVARDRLVLPGHRAARRRVIAATATIVVVAAAGGLARLFAQPGASTGEEERLSPMPGSRHAQPESAGALAIDATSGRLVMFECIPPDRARLRGWALDTNDTIAWVPDGRADPTARDFAAVASSTREPRLVIFGGTTHNAVTDVLSWYDAEGRLAQPTGASAAEDAWPAPREHASIAYDRVRDRFVVFGGGFSERNRNHVYHDDAWSLAFVEAGAPAWRRLPSGPPARRRATFVYDPSIDSFVLHGGDAGFDRRHTDTWILDAQSETWRRAATGASAPAAAGPQSATFAEGHGVLLIDPVGALWSLRNETWSRVAPPVAGLGPSIVDHPTHGLLCIGRRSGGAVVPDVSRFDFERNDWERLVGTKTGP